MSSITGSATNTLVSMLAAVQTTANTATRTVQTIASSLDMLDNYVQDARVEQIARSVAHRDSMITRIHEEASMDNAQRQDDLQSRLKTNPSLAALFKENYEKFEKTTLEKINAKLQELDQRNHIAV